MTDFLEEKRAEIRGRLDELEPLVEEYRRLKAAEDALAGVVSQASSGVTGGASGGTRRRRRASAGGDRNAARSSGGGRPGRKRGSGTRAAQALALVEANPGITIAELADNMGIQANYLYRVMPQLAEDGKVTRSGKGWHPRG